MGSQCWTGRPGHQPGYHPGRRVSRPACARSGQSEEQVVEVRRRLRGQTSHDAQAFLSEASGVEVRGRSETAERSRAAWDTCPEASVDAVGRSRAEGWITRTVDISVGVAPPYRYENAS